MIHMNYGLFWGMFWSVIVMAVIWLAGFIVIFPIMGLIKFVFKKLFNKEFKILLISLLLPILLVVGLIGSRWFNTKKGHYLIYYGQAIEGTIVDEASGKPIEGAYIAISWDMHTPLSDSQGVAHVDETKSDKNGYFKLPAWLSFSIDIIPAMGYPEIIIFKEGYRFQVFSDFLSQDFAYHNREYIEKRKEIYETGIFKIKKFEGSKKEYAKNLGYNESLMWRIRCWGLGKNIKNLWCALYQESLKLPQKYRGMTIPDELKEYYNRKYK